MTHIYMAQKHSRHGSHCFFWGHEGKRYWSSSSTCLAISTFSTSKSLPWSLYAMNGKVWKGSKSVLKQQAGTYLTPWHTRTYTHTLLCPSPLIFLKIKKPKERFKADVWLLELFFFKIIISERDWVLQDYEILYLLTFT